MRADHSFQIDDDLRVIIDATPRSRSHPAATSDPDAALGEVSPDGKQVVFETLGKQVVRKPAAGGTARRLTADKSAAFELWPSWSSDGKQIVFVRWTDWSWREGGDHHCRRRRVRKVTSVPGHYAEPALPDGKRYVGVVRAAAALTSQRWGDGRHLPLAASQGFVRITDNGAKPQFGADSDRIFMVASGDGKNQLVSTDLNGQDKQIAGAHLLPLFCRLRCCHPFTAAAPRWSATAVLKPFTTHTHTHHHVTPPPHTALPPLLTTLMTLPRL